MGLEDIAPILIFELLRNATEKAVVEEQSSCSETTLNVTDYAEVDLNQKISKLALCCQAMWELIQQNTNLTENDLGRKVMEIDMRDGLNDQHMTPKAKKCPKCDSMISVKFQRCLFCGYVDPETSPLSGF